MRVQLANTVDGSAILASVDMVQYPHYIPGFQKHPRWLARFLPSTVFSAFWKFRCSQLLSWREVRSGGVVKPVAKPKGLDPGDLWPKNWDGE